nr:unnamed protein product [Callosobruchus analis]
MKKICHFKFYSKAN